MFIGEFCVFRTYSAGIHTGYLKEIGYHPGGASAVVEECRRLWRWSDRFTLNEVALRGASEDSRISNPVARNLLTQVIEVIPCTDEAKENLRRSRNGHTESSGSRRR